MIDAPGGRLLAGESPLACAVREVQEELGITPTGLVACGENRCQFTDGFSIQLHVFAASGLEGEPVETEEALPIWTPLDRIPYHEMWEDDRLWLPLALEGRSFAGRFLFEGSRLLDHAIDAPPIAPTGTLATMAPARREPPSR